jgi:hypothetical protein
MDESEAKQLHYPLQAWVEGSYACNCDTSLDQCPYSRGSDMAFAWEQGWLYSDAIDTPGETDARTLLDYHHS